MISNHKERIISLCVIVLLAGCTSAPRPTVEWTCRNNDAEISCQGNSCDVAMPEEFTPMELTMDTNGGLSLCAYSGCWSGQANEFHFTGDYFSITGLEVPWSATEGAATDILTTINIKTGIATLLTNDFSHPMTCKAS